MCRKFDKSDRLIIMLHCPYTGHTCTHYHIAVHCEKPPMLLDDTMTMWLFININTVIVCTDILKLIE